MPEDRDDEVAAVRSIYGDETLQEADGAGVYVLTIPRTGVSLRLFLPPDYPGTIPQILGTESTGEHRRKGYGKQVMDIARETLETVYTPGSVCLFDLLQELETALANGMEEGEFLSPGHQVDTTEPMRGAPPQLHPDLEEEPHWILSTPITEKKSTFLARACSVRSPVHAKACIAHMLDTDKRAARATHNVIAYRIRSGDTAGSPGVVAFQDCDDDGETAAGGRLLHLLQVMDVWGVLVIVSRWYGGVKLGPDRFSIINNAAREAVIQGGWTKR